MKNQIVCVVGTRPEVIKMAPVIMRFKEVEWAKLTVISTGQHREMLDQAFSIFGLKPDYDLGIMVSNQTLASSVARALEALDRLLGLLEPDFVVAQGDTTSVAASALCSFYRNIPFGHVEAGLRSWDLNNPFPEEFNRIIAGRVGRLHFAPTKSSVENLRREGISEAAILLTGNTVIDALNFVPNDVPSVIQDLPDTAKIVLVTVHRRENHGRPLERVCSAVRQLAEKFADLHFVWPVHPNPNVSETVARELGTEERVRLVQPLGYSELINTMRRCHFIITDSGGIQEEAPALKVPVVVLRDITERPEAVDLGMAKLVGTDTNVIIETVSNILTDADVYSFMARGGSPYGDGRAAQRIISSVGRYLGASVEKSDAFVPL